MKILLVVPAIGAVYGGPSKVALELAEALGKQGISLDLVTTNANGASDLDVPLYTWVNSGSYRIQYFAHWHWKDYKISSSLTAWLFRHVTEYDLVHTNALFSYPILVTHWACQWHQVPYVMSPHGMLEPWALSYKAWKKKLYYTLLEKNALKKASAIQMLATSEAENTQHLNLSTPFVIVPNGIEPIDLENFPDSELFYQHFPTTKNKTLILFLGRIDPKKGLDLLATAFAKVHQQFPHTHLIVAGPDNVGFLPKVQQFFVDAGCLEAVTFTGMISGSLKYAALAAASVYVSPSYSEGFSLSILEGMAAGLPCVFTTGCNFPEAKIAQAAYVVEADSQQIADALIECLKHPQQMKAMGDRARKFILETYTWDRIASQLIKIYTAILQQKTVPISSSLL
ncbi:MAG: glycosyltransferase [Scytolyngbya sp. HA4215-MV1]|jgi:glycosyltransferase involved in cell wall biosynthesis|nr:glycosyltransferase [Scytolyngbya sp. HA4215-MV1]